MIAEVSDQDLKKTAKECFYVISFAKKISETFKRPLFVIFNARNGTVFSYGMPSIRQQLELQFIELSKRENKLLTETKKEFWQEAKNHPNYAKNKRLAVLKVARNWMTNGRLKYFIDFTVNFRYPSLSTHKIFIPAKIREIIDDCQTADILFVDTGYCLLPATIGPGFGQNKPINSYLNVNRKTFIFSNKLHKLPPDFSKITEQVKTDIDELIKNDPKELFFIMLVPAYIISDQQLKRPWYDNNPIVLGPIGRKFAHESNHKPTSQKEKNLYKKIKKIICSFIKQGEKIST